MIKFFTYEGNKEVLQCVKFGTDDSKKVVAVLGSYKVLRDMGLVVRAGAGDDSVWLVIDAKTKDVREVPDRRRAWNWCVYQYDDDFEGVAE